MRSFFANLRSLVLPAGATSGRRIVLDGVNGVIQVYNTAGDLVVQIGGVAPLDNAISFPTGDPSEDIPGTISSGISGSGGTRNIFLQFIAPAFTGATDFPFIELRSRSQNDTTDPPELRVDMDGPEGRFKIPSQIGQATLVGGTVTVPRTSILGTSRVFLSRKTIGGTPGNLSYTVIPGTSFTINSDNGADTSVVEWLHLDE